MRMKVKVEKKKPKEVVTALVCPDCRGTRITRLTCHDCAGERRTPCAACSGKGFFGEAKGLVTCVGQ